MELTLTPRQTAALADLIREHPDRELTIRQLRDRSSILAEFGYEAAIIKADETPEPAA